VADHSRRFRVDVAVSTNKPNRNRAHPGQDVLCAGVESATSCPPRVRQLSQFGARLVAESD
jgi:hypothetical protein